MVIVRVNLPVSWFISGVLAASRPFLRLGLHVPNVHHRTEGGTCDRALGVDGLVLLPGWVGQHFDLVAVSIELGAEGVWTRNCK